VPLKLLKRKSRNLICYPYDISASHYARPCLQNLLLSFFNTKCCNMAAKHGTRLQAVFCRVLCGSTGVCRRSPTEGVNPGAVRSRTRERRHIAPRSRFLLIKTRVPVSAETLPSPLLPFHHPRCLLLFLANPSSSYNPFAFESKRT
jgi:hypothetical protein